MGKTGFAEVKIGNVEGKMGNVAWGEFELDE